MSGDEDDFAARVGAAERLEAGREVGTTTTKHPSFPTKISR